MAFDDIYGGTERVNIGHSYWIEIRTCLPHTAVKAADRKLHQVRGVADEKGKMQTVITPDLEASRDEKLFHSIVAWNLDEQDGSIWALAPDSAKRRNIDRLPDLVCRKILRRIDELNADDPDERRDFRPETVGGAADGHTGTTEPSEVPDGEPAVGEAGHPR